MNDEKLPVEETAYEEEKSAFALELESKGVVFSDIQEVAESLTLEEAKAIIHEAIRGKEYDPLFDQSLLARARSALTAEALSQDVAQSLVDEIKLEAALMDDSPYVEVRSAVANTDDPTMYVNTFRAWSIGLIFTIIGTGVNVFFAARNPGIILNSFVAQVVTFPIAKAMERLLPTYSVKAFGRSWSLNPGPFNQKEHMLITIMANVTFGGIIGVYSTDIIFVQRLPQFFNQNLTGSNAGYQILLTLSTQLIGFSMAGLTRRFLVYPADTIWPVALATITLNRSFHAQENPVANGWSISRLKFFLIVFVAYGLYFVIPDAVFSATLYFNWLTWISPTNAKLAMITGSISGLGISPWTTFDWSYASALNNPLITPLFSTVSLYLGAVTIGLTMIPAIYFSNTWFTGYLPINSNHIFDNTGGRYNVSQILNPDFTLNVTAYKAYSPVYQSAGNAVVFFAFFALYTATLVHCGLYYRKEIITGFRSLIKREDARLQYNDVHNRLMRVYPEVSEWWYAGILLFSLACGIIANEVYKTQLPVWALFYSVLLGLVFLVPCGIIYAITNQEVTLNVLFEIQGSYMFRGKPLANMIFKMYGVIGVAQAIGFANDLKLAHYCKLPPRTVFTAQLVASVLASFVGIGVADWQIENLPNICQPGQVSGFTCPGYSTFFNSAVQWGTIGAGRLYSAGQIYNAVFYGFVFGAILPVPVYMLTRRYPNSFWKFVSVPVFLYGPLNFAPYNLSYLTPGLYIALGSMYFVRKHYLPWWTKYNYVLATALTASISVFGVIWFFALLYNPDTAPVWWGNTVPFEGCDGSGCPLLTLNADQLYFGPGPGEF